MITSTCRLLYFGDALIRMIKRKSDRIKGIQLSDKTIKISQLADDTTLLAQDIESVKVVLGFLSDFSTYSGLNLNTSKTEAVWLGRNVNKKDKPHGLH